MRWWKLDLKEIKEGWPLFILEAAAIAAGIAALYISIFQWREQLVSNSWATLATQVTGSSGKAAALKYLAWRNQPLAAIDLSCRTMGGYDTVSLLREPLSEPMCVRRPYLAPLDLHWTGMWWSVDLIDANLSGAHISAKEQKADLRDVLLTRAQLRGTNLMFANFSGALLDKADLSGAHISGANFSGAILEGANFENAWYWDDQPPIGLDLSSVGIACRLQPGDDYWFRPDRCYASPNVVQSDDEQCGLTNCPPP